MTRLAKGRHECDLPSPFDHTHGAIIRCSNCGREWKAFHHVNSRYSGWKPPLFGKRFLRRWPLSEDSP